MRLRFIALGLLLLATVSCSRQSEVAAKRLPTRTEIWKAILPQAQRYEIPPALVYALVAAESNFDPAARNGDARGLMQIKEIAWKEVCADPYEPGVWDWRKNLEVGIDYLAFLRHRLHAVNKFSNPIWIASFHYGLSDVVQSGYDLSQWPEPDAVILRELWRGNLSPVPPP